jgi:predicted aldo/keto reductase-like oxidoreductase
MTTKRNKNSRRDFLKKGMAGFAGISLIPYLLKGKSQANEETKNVNKKKIVYRTLGRTGIKVPIVSIGATSLDITRAALDAGIIYLDTAHRYGGGAHEAIVGEVLQGRPRKSFVITTKIYGLRDKRTGLLPKNLSAAQFRADFRRRMDDSFKKLKQDSLDILFLHGVDNPKFAGVQIVKDVMLELKEEGKTRFLGTTFHHKEVPLIRAAVKQKIYDVIITSYNFRQPHREEVKKAIAYATNAGLGVVAMKTIAGAYWDKERKYPINTKAALKWVLQNENIHTIIPGIETFDQLELDMSVMEDLSLTSQEQEDLKFGQKSSMPGLYCAQCGRCRLQCRYNLDIPTMMRSYMYAYGYKNPELAKETLESVVLPNTRCIDCHTCSVTCSMEFDVRNKILDIVRLKDVPEDFLA